MINFIILTYKNIGDIMEKIIIDIRDSFEYKRKHIDNSINIPFDLLELCPERYLSKNNIYYLYCDKGIKSKEISIKLNKKGYKTYSYKAIEK